MRCARVGLRQIYRSVSLLSWVWVWCAFFFYWPNSIRAMSFKALEPNFLLFVWFLTYISIAIVVNILLGSILLQGIIIMIAKN